MKTETPNFDPYRHFSSPSEAISYAETQPDPVDAAKQIVAANIDWGEDCPIEERSRHLNNALAYAFELLEEIRVPGTPKTNATDVPWVFDEFLSNDPKHFEAMRKATEILSQQP